MGKKSAAIEISSDEMTTFPVVWTDAYGSPVPEKPPPRIVEISSTRPKRLAVAITNYGDGYCLTPLVETWNKAITVKIGFEDGSVLQQRFRIVRRR